MFTATVCFWQALRFQVAHVEEDHLLSLDKSSVPSLLLVGGMLLGLAMALAAFLAQAALRRARDAEMLSRSLVDEIAEHERAEEALRRFRHIVSSSTDMLTLLDENYVYLAANEAYLKAFGKTREELIGHSAAEVFGDAFFDATIRPNAERCLAGEEVRYEDWFEFPVLGRRYMDIAYFPYAGVDRQIRGFVVCGRDATERKLAEEALRESEERYRAIAEDTPVLICRSLPGGEITYANDAYCHYFQKTADELVGSSFYTLIPEADRDTVMAFISALTVESPTQSLEHLVIAAGGEIRWQQWVNRALFDAKGEAVAYQSIGEDITDRKRAEEALRRNEERFRLLYERTPICYQSLDESGRILEVNQAWLDTLGFTREEAVGRWFADFLTPEYVGHFRRNFPCFRTAGEIHQVQFEMIRKDGSHIFTEYEGRIGYDEAGDLQQTHCVFQDITERRRTEQALHEAHQELERRVEERTADLAATVNRLQEEIAERTRAEQALRLSAEIMDNMAEGVSLVRAADGVIVYANPRFEQMLGYGHGELNGQPVRIVNAPTDKRPKGVAAEMMIALKEAGRWRGEVKNLRKDGTTFWCHANVPTFEHPEYGSVWVSVHADITDRKLAEEAVRRTERLATIGTFSAGIAHEINNPLGMIMLDTDSALKSVHEPVEVEKLLRQSRQNVERCARIVKGVLRFARDQSTEKRPLDLNDVVRRTLDFTQEYARKHGVTVEARLSDTLHPILGNSTEMEQVGVNLVHNAVHACGEGGRVSLETSEVDERVRLVVHDDGCGMTEEEAKHVFDPFYTTRLDRGGTGLGLSTVHGIVTDHGGTIDVASEEGKGTTFTLVLPRHNATEAANGKDTGSGRRGGISEHSGSNPDG